MYFGHEALLTLGTVDNIFAIGATEMHKCLSRRCWAFNFFACFAIIGNDTFAEPMYCVTSSSPSGIMPSTYFQKCNFIGSPRFCNPSTADTTCSPNAYTS